MWGYSGCGKKNARGAAKLMQTLSHKLSTQIALFSLYVRLHRALHAAASFELKMAKPCHVSSPQY